MIVDRILELYRTGAVSAEVAEELLPYPVETYMMEPPKPVKDDRGIKRVNSQMSDGSHEPVPCLRDHG